MTCVPSLVCVAVANSLEGWHELPMGSFRNPPSSYHRVLMLQRLCTVTALLAAAAAVGDAVNVHIKVHHPRAATNVTTATNATATTSGSGSAAGNSSAWHMKPVVSIQARVQGDTPLWDATKKAYVSSYGKTFDAQYRGVLDTVNTASVEGALMYVQAEGINKREQSVQCERKNKMANVVFYEITMVQPTPAIAYYNGKHSTPEYCPFVAMDSGKCTEAGSDIPDTCKQYDGLDGQAKVGHCVGANEQTTDPRAPYPGNYWFSFPNNCVTKKWADKTDECRTEYAGGLCPFGTKPDGETCTFSYKILGYLSIDDLVGITDGTAADGTKYANFAEFCKAGHVEFDAENTGKGFEVKESIAFWEDPSDPEANSDRTKQMIEKYNELAPKAKNGTMTALPVLSELTASNPPCYESSPECATAKNGCRRTLYSQICQVCESASADCVSAPATFKFPELPVPEGKKAKLESGSASGSVDGSGSGAGKNTVDGKAPAPSSAITSALLSTAAVAFSAVAAALL